MDIGILTGYVGAVVIGVTLGLIGGGGSILTVPVLVYLMGIEPVLATAYSLFVVGFTSVIGTAQKYTVKEVDTRTAILFVLPSLVSIFLTRRFFIPKIQDMVWGMEKGTLLMVFFSLIMLVAGLAMLRQKRTDSAPKERKGNFGLVILEGFFVGFLTGVVGAGGGFLIIPALVLLGGLNMKIAVGTSLFIIALKSAIGFTGDLGAGQDIDWGFLLLFTALSALGIILGVFVSKKIDGTKLKKGFGYFVVVMAIFIAVKELLLT
jgi:uncharacterized membrane protein YfcA